MICAFWGILSSKRMVAHLKVMSIVLVYIVKQHHLFAAKAHLLCHNCDDCKETAYMCQIPDKI